MVHETALIALLAISLVLALIGGFVAAKLHLPPLVGYLVAGIACGPSTPGFVGDKELAQQLAEIGVILLMFGVGMHFSFRDLLAVRAVALPGALIQTLAVTGLGMLIAWYWDWGIGAGIVLGLALAVASTVVLLRSLEDSGGLDSIAGRIAIGWLVVEDLLTVVVLVILPPLAGLLGGHTDLGGHGSASSGGLLVVLPTTLAKVAIFVVFMLGIGTRVLPWVLGQVAATGSRELFTLSVIAIALGVGFGSAELLGLSFALGAFFAGVVVNGSDFSQRAAQDTQPLQDAFAVLFFVSVGMLFNPAILITEPLHVLAVLAVIVVAKPLVTWLIMRVLRQPDRAARHVAAGLGQVGEFSFILVGLGLALGLLPAEGQDLVLAGSLLAITLNPFSASIAASTEAMTWGAMIGAVWWNLRKSSAARPSDV